MRFAVVAAPPVGDGLAAVDIQLVEDALAADGDFTGEYGVVVAPGNYRHQTLAERVGAAEMARVRRVVGRLVEGLLGAHDRLVWFAPADSWQGREGVRMSAWVDEAGLNCKIAMYDGEPGGVASELERLGQYDAVRAVAGPGLTLARLLPVLTLARPVPTSAGRLAVGPEDFGALRAVLGVAALLFEEVGNGTRLRVVSRVHSPEAIEAAVRVAVT